MVFRGVYVGAGYRAPVGFGSGGRVGGGWTGSGSRSHTFGGGNRMSPAAFGSGSRRGGVTFGSGN